jgi:hypothetical protein
MREREPTMPRLVVYVLALLLLSGSLLLLGCSGSGGSSEQSATPTGPADDTGGGPPAAIPDDQVGFSTGGEHGSSQYRLKLTIGETPTDGTQQRTSRSYNLTIGIGTAQSGIGG